MKKRILYWLQNDLRIDDNPILNDLSQQQCELDIVFVINPAWFKSNNYQQKPYGVHKQRFLMQSLYELQESVLGLGQTLHILEGDPVRVLTQRINELGIDEVVYSEQIGVYEQRQITALKSKCATVVFKSVMQDTLYQQQQLPFELADLPTGFTPFRKKSKPLVSVYPQCRSQQKDFHRLLFYVLNSLYQSRQQETLYSKVDTKPALRIVYSTFHQLYQAAIKSPVMSWVALITRLNLVAGWLLVVLVPSKFFVQSMLMKRSMGKMNQHTGSSLNCSGVSILSGMQLM